MNRDLLVCFALATCALAAPETISGKVVAVHDGDTLTLLTVDKAEVKVRLEGIREIKTGKRAPRIAIAYGAFKPALSKSPIYPVGVTPVAI